MRSSLPSASGFIGTQFPHLENGTILLLGGAPGSGEPPKD